MTLRFKLVATAFILFILLAQSHAAALMQSSYAMFVALGILLVFSVLALWPNSTPDRVDRGHGRGGWAARIDFDRAPDGGRDAQS
ncbi:MAG: hypothetical protein JNM89_06490 [Hyphomicrobiaceae bacterium]|nr:hypothetical protein [Hyphomicrobiaceae bacterium]